MSTFHVLFIPYKKKIFPHITSNILGKHTDFKRKMELEDNLPSLVQELGGKLKLISTMLPLYTIKPH